MTADTGVLRAPGFARLWIAGGLASAMLWLEMLAAALCTLAATGSPFAVALVSASRAAPLLLAGAFVGVLADAWDRRRIVLAGMLLTAASSAAVAVLAEAGVLRPWQLGLAGLISGLVYATEMPARRRLIAELAGPARVPRAVAIDSLTGFATRCAGPLLGGLAMAAVGIGGAYAVSALASLLAAGLVAGIAHRQEVRTLSFSSAWRDLGESLAFARRSRTVAALLAITTVMNLLGYSYTALMAPVGQALALSDVSTGVLAATEPAGALLGGLFLVRRVLGGAKLAWLGGGAALLMTALMGVAAAASAGFPVWCVCVIFIAGGAGVAVYTNMQTLIVMATVPAALRSRVFGLVAVAVGGWPLGQLIAGAVAEWLPAPQALAVLGTGGLACLAAVFLAVPSMARLRA